MSASTLVVACGTSSSEGSVGNPPEDSGGDTTVIDSGNDVQVMGLTDSGNDSGNDVQAMGLVDAGIMPSPDASDSGPIIGVVVHPDSGTD
jgi:hypothetical protein